jgi:hypothetical protein
MRPDDVLEKLKTVPFKPFRLHLSDGTKFDIRHPECAIVTRSKVVVGVPDTKGPQGLAQRTVDCSLLHITHMTDVNGGTKSSRRRARG